MDAEHYHHLAEECRRNAEAAVDVDVKKRWLWLSEGWAALAKSAAVTLLNSTAATRSKSDAENHAYDRWWEVM